VTALEKKREHHIRKLQSTEKRKATIEERREQAKRKKTASKTYRGAYELNSCESEINNIKKEVKAVNETIDKVKNEGINNAKKLEVEFHKVVAQEEGKIKQLNDTFEAKINDKKQQIDEITKEVVTIKSSFENIMQELKHSSSALRQQIEIRCELDTQEKPFRALLPIYIVKYVKGSEERYTLFLPISISQDVSVLNGLRKIITFSSDPKLKGVTRSASKKLHETLTMNVIGRIQNDVEFKNRVNNLLRANNFLDTMEFAETLNLGLDELTKLNWMTSEEAVSLCKSIMGEGA
jgi:ribosomal protein S20